MNKNSKSVNNLVKGSDFLKKIILTVLLISVFMFSSCAKKVDKELLGSWEKDGYIFEFKQNGIAYINGTKYKYTSNGESLTLYNNDKTVNANYEYTPDGVKINGCSFFSYEKKNIIVEMFEDLAEILK